jgi:hypothetical protein
MNELVQLIQQKTGLSEDVAQTVVNTVMEHLKGRLPANMAAGLDQVMAGGESTGAGGLMDQAKSMVAGMMGSKDA